LVKKGRFIVHSAQVTTTRKYDYGDGQSLRQTNPSQMKGFYDEHCDELVKGAFYKEKKFPKL
ncbi:hypothetical protein CCACVL1_12724, partial [Corchorus capsularis]